MMLEQEYHDGGRSHDRKALAARDLESAMRDSKFSNWYIPDLRILIIARHSVAYL